jgi:hypothetical protein
MGGATHVEHPNHLAYQAVRLRLGAGRGQQVKHNRTETGECELDRHHEPVRSGTGDDDIDRAFAHRRPLPPTVRNRR